MPGEQVKRFIAESGHERPAVAGLSGILDRYDQHRAVVEADSPVKVTLEEREQFALDYSAFREHGLRAALEEVGWQLEQRGHHAWIEDVGADALPPALETAREQRAVPRRLVLRVLPAHVPLDRAAAPQLRFVPDSDACRVRIETVQGDPQVFEPVPVSVPMLLEQLSEGLLIEIASDFVREVLLSGEPIEVYDTDGDEVATSDRAFDGSVRPGSEPAPAPAPASDVPHDWGDTGITRRWLAQQEQARKAT